jgi:hypothetical protein
MKPEITPTLLHLIQRRLRRHEHIAHHTDLGESRLSCREAAIRLENGSRDPGKLP